jgi:hypothetical protein
VRKKDLCPKMKMKGQAVYMSSADLHHCNLGNKRKRNVKEWKDRQQKYLGDAGKPYRNREGVGKEGKTPLKKVHGRTVYESNVNGVAR